MSWAKELGLVGLGVGIGFGLGWLVRRKRCKRHERLIREGWGGWKVVSSDCALWVVRGVQNVRVVDVRGQKYKYNLYVPQEGGLLPLNVLVRVVPVLPECKMPGFDKFVECLKEVKGNHGAFYLDVNDAVLDGLDDALSRTRALPASAPDDSRRFADSLMPLQDELSAVVRETIAGYGLSLTECTIQHDA